MNDGLEGAGEESRMRAGYEKLTEDPPLSGLSASSCAPVLCVGDAGEADMIASEVLTFDMSPCFAAPK